ncbi:hypothetical protein FQN54_009384 [Arachnomyces sp. PD_36]|nr:hypothetical protein FQN54_009384 [Arachnomyces sp. PD_36]
MKVILTGVTGFVGHEVLKQCLENPSITSVVALSRRELPSSVMSNPKLKVTIMNDFLSYSESTLEDLKGAKACIWSLGKPYISNNELARKVSIDYTLAAAKIFDQQLSSGPGKGEKFRFVYCSGAATERDQTRSLWFAQEYRRIRGQVESDLLSFAEKHEETFQACVLRPAMILSKETNLRSLIFSLGPSIRVDALAAAMLRVALNGSVDQTLENPMIKQLAA